jgi:hypothetical protein
MLRDMEYLMQLQEIDVRIHEQELAKKQLPATVAELQKLVDMARKNMENSLAQARSAEQELLSLDDHMVKAQENLVRSQERLNSIKTNREYDAVHAEIEAQKGIIHSSESRKKKINEEIDRQKAIAEAASKEFEQVTAENEPKIAELSATIASIDSVIAGIEKEREALKPLITKSILRTYDLIRSRRNHGRVLSEVSTARTCTVCYKVLEPHLVSDIKRATKLILCQNCGSIFAWTDKA